MRLVELGVAVHAHGAPRLRRARELAGAAHAPHGRLQRLRRAAVHPHHDVGVVAEPGHVVDAAHDHALRLDRGDLVGERRAGRGDAVAALRPAVDAPDRVAVARRCLLRHLVAHASPRSSSSRPGVPAASCATWPVSAGATSSVHGLPGTAKRSRRMPSAAARASGTTCASPVPATAAPTSLRFGCASAAARSASCRVPGADHARGLPLLPAHPRARDRRGQVRRRGWRARPRVRARRRRRRRAPRSRARTCRSRTRAG